MEQATAAGWWRKGPWTPQEDELLFQYISHSGEGRWSSVSKCTGLKRSGKSCRLRWVNYLRPGLKKGQLTPQEEGIIIELHALWGNKWSTIARYLPGRTDNEIKNYWRTHFKTRSPSRPKQEKRKTLFQQQQQQQQQESQSDDANIYVSSESSSHENKDEEIMAFPSIDNHMVYQETASSSSSSSDFIPMDCYLWGGLWDMDGGDDDHLRHNMPADVADYYHPFEGDGVDCVQAAAEFLLSGN